MTIHSISFLAQFGWACNSDTSRMHICLQLVVSRSSIKNSHVNSQRADIQNRTSLIVWPITAWKYQLVDLRVAVHWLVEAGVSMQFQQHSEVRNEHHLWQHSNASIELNPWCAIHRTCQRIRHHGLGWANGCSLRSLDDIVGYLNKGHANVAKEHWLDTAACWGITWSR